MTLARSEPDAPFWDNIIRTDHWDLVHSYNASISGWLVLVARQHRDSIADLSEAEADELGPLMRSTSLALKDITGCEKTYIAQFAEHPDHRHVHVHVIAIATDHPAHWRGPGVFAALQGEPLPEQVRNQMALELRDHEALAAFARR